MSTIHQLAKQLGDYFKELALSCDITCQQVTLTVPKEKIREVCYALRDNDQFQFDVLIDICGVDYLHYGQDEWTSDKATMTGFSRGVDRSLGTTEPAWKKPRFAVVYHLLSIAHNHRLRLKILTDDEPPLVDSVIEVWSGADWFEREAYDFFGILFNGHPDLRRILTDYGFIGHPFRKDFPISGYVEMRYDKTLGRVVYEPVDIEPRVLVPKVIRHDSRYLHPDAIVKEAKEKING